MVSFVDPASGLEREVTVAKKEWGQLAVGDPLVAYDRSSRRKVRFVHESRPMEAANIPQLMFVIGMMLTLGAFILAGMLMISNISRCS